MMNSPYVGRFAPSPSGPLHLGSLTCALASYLDAKKNDGIWFVRIEDIDSSRCKKEHTTSIIETLNSYQLISDTDITLQSDRQSLYQATLNKLTLQNSTFPCNCTRQQLSQKLHTSYCQSDTSKSHSWRLKSPNKELAFTDLIQGQIKSNLLNEIGHPILQRKDNEFSYLLSVVVDDHNQGVTHVVRGMDLLKTTAIQIYLFSSLGWTPPSYGHIPLVKDAALQKLSKQNHAPAIKNGCIKTLLLALKHLDITPTETKDIGTILQQALLQWKREKHQVS